MSRHLRFRFQLLPHAVAFWMNRWEDVQIMFVCNRVLQYGSNGRSSKWQRLRPCLASFLTSLRLRLPTPCLLRPYVQLYVSTRWLHAVRLILRPIILHQHPAACQHASTAPCKEHREIIGSICRFGQRLSSSSVSSSSGVCGDRRHLITTTLPNNHECCSPPTNVRNPQIALLARCCSAKMLPDAG